MGLSVPGSDFYCIDDIDPALSIVSGNDCLGQALVRRISTPRLGLFYDPDYGIDARRYLGRAVRPNVTSQAIESECMKDERLEDITVGVSFRSNDEPKDKLSITLKCTTDGGPFDLTVAIDDLTVELLDEAI